jgi:hypothetical protein
MMTQMMEEQRIAIAEQIQRDTKQAARRKAEMRKMLAYSATVVFVIILFVIFFSAMAIVVQDRINKYPHLGTGWVPKSEAERRYDALPKRYIGR